MKKELIKGLQIFFYLFALISLFIITPVLLNKVTYLTYKKKYENFNILDSIHSEIINLNIEHPEIVYNQFLLETGNGTSKLFKENNNLFGMKNSGNRITTSDSILNGYKYYSHWRESILDYGFLQASFYKGLTLDEYLNRLSKS